MSKQYTGPLAGIRRWNHRRLERRRWQRELLEALAQDDASIMEGLSRVIGEIRGDAAARAAVLEQISGRLEGVAARQEAAMSEAAARATTLERLSATIEAVAARQEAAMREAAARATTLERLSATIEAVAARQEAATGEAAARATTQARLSAAIEAVVARQEGWMASQLPVPARSADGFRVIATERASLLEPELSVLADLATSLFPKVAVDVGAHHGAYTRALLALGFEVHALEPNPAAREELIRQLSGRAGLTVHACAAGAEEGEGCLRLVIDETGEYTDPTQFASLADLPPPPGLVSAGSVTVPVRRLDALMRERRLAPSIVKVDAEGYDLAVLHGMGALKPAVLIAEFWDEELPFSHPRAQNRLPDLVAYARSHGAPHHLVVFRRWGDDRPAFFSGWAASPERSWGNVLFFREAALFERARQHLATLLPEATFVRTPAARPTAEVGSDG